MGFGHERPGVLSPVCALRMVAPVRRFGSAGRFRIGTSTGPYNTPRYHLTNLLVTYSLATRKCASLLTTFQQPVRAFQPHRAKTFPFQSYIYSDDA